MKLMISSLFLEALLHQLFAKIRMRCSTFTILQQEQSSLLEILVLFFHSEDNGLELPLALPSVSYLVQ